MLRDTGQEHLSNGHRPPESKRKRQKTPRPVYTAMSPDIGFVPRGQPLPFAQAVRQLPHRYHFVLTKPGLETFLAEKNLADWKINWFQLLVYALLAALLAFLNMIWTPAQTLSSSGNGLSSPAIGQALGLASSLGLLVLIPLFFFAAMGLLYILARRMGGHGVFGEQVHTTLLFLTPCGILVSLLGVIPFAGNFLSAFLGAILFVYCVALQCFATVAVHQMTGGKATAAVIITVLILIPAIIAALFLWAFLFVAA